MTVAPKFPAHYIKNNSFFQLFFLYLGKVPVYTKLLSVGTLFTFRRLLIKALRDGLY